MEYHIERLLPIVAELSVRYTSGESCSVSYEAAQALMEAVIYCIRECVTDTEHGISAGRMPQRSCGTAMQTASRTDDSNCAQRSISSG